MNLRILQNQAAKITVAFPRLNNGLYQKTAVKNLDISTMVPASETEKLPSLNSCLLDLFQMHRIGGA
jgi:hypothetical protein